MGWPGGYDTGYSPNYTPAGYTSDLTPIEPNMSSHLPTGNLAFYLNA